MSENKTVKDYLYDHYLVIVGALVGIFGIGGIYFLRVSIGKFVNWQYSGWIFSAVILSAIIVYSLTRKMKNKTSRGRVVVGPPRIKHIEYKPIENHGVIWRFWRGNNVPNAFDYALGDAPVRSWVDGPFCIECDYELEQDNAGKKWICANRHRKVSIPKTLRGNVREKIIKTFDAELRRQEVENKK